MPPDPKPVQYRGRYYVEFYEGQKRRRLSLGTADKSVAQASFSRWLREVNRPDASTIKTLWNAYVADNRGKAVIATMTYTWKALAPTFGDVRPEDVSAELCRSHTAARRGNGIQDGTIWTELGHLRTVLSWAYKRGVIERAPHVERPTKPAPRERHLTQAEARKLVASCVMPHIKLFVILALTTAARRAALLDLTWDRVNVETGMIDLRNPGLARRHKGRALVPMNRQAKAALLEAQKGAVSDFVIEWAGEQVASVRKGLGAAAERAGLPDITPHVFRHTAAVWMAEGGVPMDEIKQFLGHAINDVTQSVYARFSPNYLRKAAATLEFDELSEAAERKVK